MTTKGQKFTSVGGERRQRVDKRIKYNDVQPKRPVARKVSPRLKGSRRATSR